MIVLVHGSMDRSSTFTRVVRALGDRHVVAYDRRGYGKSASEGPGATLHDHADDLVALLDGRPAVVAGHSYGGDVAMVAAIARPDLVRSLAVWEPPMPWLPWWPADTAGGVANAAAADPAGAAEAFMRYMIGDERWDKLPPSTKAARRAEGRTLVAELASVNEPAFDPAAVPVPVVVGTGSASKPHHRGTADALMEMLPAGAERFLVEGADHGCHLTHPAEFARFVERARSFF